MRPMRYQPRTGEPLEVDHNVVAGIAQPALDRTGLMPGFCCGRMFLPAAECRLNDVAYKR